jgi:uncharacterized protein YlaN (UPF0358 family)
MKEQRYIKDPYTGAVVFTDTDAYAARRKVLDRQKKELKSSEDSKKVINSLRNELSELKNLVRELIDK